MKEKEIVITCPKCGRQYLPSEIFFPDDFLGKPHGITRDEEGKIIYYEGQSMWPVEEYICDNCGTKFQVNGIVKFDTKEVVDIFDDEYSTKLK